MPAPLLTIEALMTALPAAPGRIAEVTAGLADEQLRLAPEPGKWSATEVLAHLRACADMWGRCIDTMLAEDHPTIRAINPRRWITQTDYPEQPFSASLAAFAAQRAELVATLERLDPAGWQRPATITGAGRALERTVHAYADRLARHERPHIDQIGRAAAPDPGRPARGRRPAGEAG